MKKENKKKKYLLIIALIWCIMSFLIIVATYSKYLSSVNANTDIGISSWSIVVNNQDITQNSDFSNNLSLVIPESDYYIEDYLVPGCTGYFDLVIDSSNVTLPFNYTITLEADEDSDISDVELTGYSVLPGSQVYNIDPTTHQIQHSVNPNVNEVSIRVFVQWNDEDTNQMNDIADTAVANSEGSSLINVNIAFTQTS